MTTYKFKTSEDIDTKSRTIIETEDVPAVPATTKDTEYTIEHKENELASLVEQKVKLDIEVVEKEAKLTEAKTALGVK